MYLLHIYQRPAVKALFYAQGLDRAPAQTINK